MHSRQGRNARQKWCCNWLDSLEAALHCMARDETSNSPYRRLTSGEPVAVLNAQPVVLPSTLQITLPTHHRPTDSPSISSTTSRSLRQLSLDTSDQVFITSDPTRNFLLTQSWQRLIAMAPIKNNMSSSNNRNGEAVGRQANVLASCYVVDTSACLTGFHYSTTGAGG